MVLEKHPACVDCGSTEFLEFDHDPPYEQTGRTRVDQLWPAAGPATVAAMPGRGEGVDGRGAQPTGSRMTTGISRVVCCW